MDIGAAAKATGVSVKMIRHYEVSTLNHLVAHCHGDERPDCPILDDLSG